MADLDNLTLTVEATSSEATSEVRRLTRSLKNLQGALSGLDAKKLSELTSGMGAVKNTVKNTGLSSYTKQLKEQSKALEGFKKSANFTKGFVGAGWKGAKQTIVGVSGALKGMSNMFGLGAITSGKFVTSLARIAGYRFIRTLISSITKGATTGLENLARASSEANATLSQLSSGALTLQNAMGGALYSVLASIIGVLNSIINAAVSAINWISMLFAILGGKATFKKATSATKEYAGALGGAGGAAKALKQELMGFDEINSLSPDTGGGGGGGGGAGMLDYDSMFEETPVSESLKDMVERADFTLLGETLANKVNSALGKIDWSKIQTGAYKLARSLVTFLNGFIGQTDATVIGDTIAGLINTGLTFINTFAYDTNWREFGNKIKVAIRTAISKIPPQSIGNAIVARMNMAIEFFTGLIPKTGEEWKEITDWIAESLKASVEAINPHLIGGLVGDLIIGGLQLMISLGSSGLFSNITTAIATALTEAISNISEEDLKTAAEVVITEALKVLKIAFELIVDISDTTLGKGLTAFGLYRLISSSMKGMGITGYKAAGNSLTLAGALTFAFEAVAGISKILPGVENGSGVSFDDLADIASSALKATGLALLSVAPVAGIITFGIGFGLDLINQFVNLDETFGKIGQVVNATVGGAMVEGLNNLETATDGVKLSTEELANVTKITNDIMESGTSPALALTALFIGGKVSAAEYAAVLQNFGITAESVQGSVQGVSDALSSVSAGNTETAVENVSSALDGLSSAVDEMPIAVDVPKADTGVASSYDTVTTSMKATGEQAEELYSKIITIPSDIVYNLELNNYETVITQLETLSTSISTSATEGSGSFQTAFSGLPNWFGSSVIDPLKSKATGINWYNIGNQVMTAFKRGLKSVSMPTFSVSWTTATNSGSIFGKQYSVSIPYPSISIYAAGGFPDVGELFVANEAGPELVGRIGSKPAVANQEQIGDAIFRYMDAHEQQGGGMNYDSLASAMVRAMKSAGLGAFYLDGRQIKQSLNREAQRSGKPIAGY